MRFSGLLLVVLTTGLARVAGADPVKAGSPVVIDSSGKEIPLKQWKLTAGTRPLTWLPKDGATPEALAFRETNSTTFKDGVVTLIPLERLESLTYDVAKTTVHAKIAGLAQPLEGSIRYKETNQLTITAEVDKGSAGVVEVKYRGGLLEGGIRGVRFSGAVAGAPGKGDRVLLTIADKAKKEKPQTANGLHALYRTKDGKEVLSTSVMFKKTFKVELAQIANLKLTEEKDLKSFACDVKFTDASAQALTLLLTLPIDGKDATLTGFLVEVPAGYKLYPPHCLAEITRDQAGEPKKEK